MVALKAVSAIGVSALLAGAALAQATTTPVAPIPGTLQPTVVQCNQGWKDGMAWTKEQFTKACVDLKAKNSGG